MVWFHPISEPLRLIQLEDFCEKKNAIGRQRGTKSLLLLVTTFFFDKKYWLHNSKKKYWLQLTRTKSLLDHVITNTRILFKLYFLLIFKFFSLSYFKVHTLYYVNIFSLSYFKSLYMSYKFFFSSLFFYISNS